MKFSLLAILPAAAWTAVTLATADPTIRTDADAGSYILVFVLWFLTAAVIGLYWAARIVRFALRGPRGRHDLQQMRGQGPSVQV